MMAARHFPFGRAFSHPGGPRKGEPRVFSSGGSMLTASCIPKGCPMGCGWKSKISQNSVEPAIRSRIFYCSALCPKRRTWQIKGGKGMGTRIVLVFAAWILCVGCAPSFPKMPPVKTKQARACLRACQRDHNACSDTCTDGDNVTKFGSRETCVDGCVEALEACYARCVGMDPQQ